MSNNNQLFVDVDTQHDFCDPSGTLFVAGAPAVMDAIRRLVRVATDTNALLVGSVDSHDFTAWEFADNGGPFPPHCVKGTPGWLKMPGTMPSRTTFVPNVERTTFDFVPDGAEAVLFEKEVYSLFANPAAEGVLDALLARRSVRREDVEAIVFGVATDYCVKAAALGLLERRYRVAVVVDAIAAVDEASGERALAEMKEAGCRLVRTEQVT